jgi:hypothetical protein
MTGGSNIGFAAGSDLLPVRKTRSNLGVINFPFSQWERANFVKPCYRQLHVLIAIRSRVVQLCYRREVDLICVGVSITFLLFYY